MATITGLTAARMLLIEAASVISGAIVGDDLILTKHDSSTINAGNVRGANAARNRIINGDFAVNQRAFTSTTVTPTYGFDRWRFAFVGGTNTYSSQTPALGELPESAKAYARIVSSGQAAASDLVYLQQRIESVRNLSGKTATVSFWAKAAAGTPNVSVELNQNFGTGGSPSTQVDIYAGKVTLSTTWTRYSVTVAIPSISGKTVGTGGDDFLVMSLWTSAGSNFNARTGSLGLQNTTIDFWGVQVEDSPKVTPFEQEEYAVNLRRCQRYYWDVPTPAQFDPIGVGQVITTIAARIVVPFPVPMRMAPTLGTSTGTYILHNSAGSGIGVTGISIDRASTTCARLIIDAGGGGLVAGNATYLSINTTPGSVKFSAEL